MHDIIRFINEQCTNHFIYADDICVFAPSPSGLQNLYIPGNMYNYYIVFKAKKFKLFIPDMIFNSPNLKPSVNVKYFKLNENTM